MVAKTNCSLRKLSVYSWDIHDVKALSGHVGDGRGFKVVQNSTIIAHEGSIRDHLQFVTNLGGARFADMHIVPDFQ